ncbi:hypothetical protein TSAR_012935 [Trichomalopsis sarcophagae]|uniref:Reverse transcriptase domain-containing protein n=1 Tax=Trichomalopsis sarcophagae TaxID=543379 RepID=A0A232EDV0_9HYME|nr:hypothetical protein TSAR_012935 [Trichomalopsis sarcophagae]
MPASPDAFNAHFIGVSGPVIQAPLPVTRPSSDSVLDFHRVDAADVLEALTSATSMAQGADSISLRHLRDCVPIILNPLANIFDSSLRAGYFPVEWKHALVRPLPKRSLAENVEDFRPVSIFKAPAKLLESVALAQINEFVTQNNILDDYQSGFHKGHSTDTAMIGIVDDLRLAVNNEHVSVVVGIDFSRAFDLRISSILLCERVTFLSCGNALVRPLPKRSLAENVEDFRPVIILKAPAKLLESVALAQINEFVTQNNILDDYQSGFRKGHSTDTAVIRIVDDLRLAVNNEHVSVVVGIDFSRAFDLVNIDLLVCKLYHLGFSDRSCSWVRSYLSDRSQAVVFPNGDLSAPLIRNSGAPQGSLPGPLFFSLFINDLPRVLESCKYQLYAEDFVIYLEGSFRELDNTIEKLNRDLSNIVNWAACNGLIINATKTQAMWVGSRGFISRLREESPPAIVFSGTGYFPVEWKHALVRPLPKRSLAENVEDFRPVSILKAPAKLLESVALAQINEFVTQNNILDDYQSGFHKGHSTDTAMIGIVDDLRLAVNNEHVSVLVGIDFSRAFDLVNIDLLVCKLYHLGFLDRSCSWVRSYLSDRSQAVVFPNGDLSAQLIRNSGVPQGSLPGPLFFSLFINDLPRVLESCKYQLYADDFVIYLEGSFRELDNIIQKMNRDLSNIVNWAACNGLIINATKTQAMWVGSRGFISRLREESPPAIVFSGSAIIPSDSLKILGVTIDSTLSWRSMQRHIKEMLRSP